MEKIIRKTTGLILLVIIYFFVVGLLTAHAAPSVKRIAVLPVYINSDGVANIQDGMNRSKKMAWLINNPLYRADFEVINLFDYNIGKNELKRLLKRAAKNNEQISDELCYRYGLDAVIVVNLYVKTIESSVRYSKAIVHAYVDGYDNTGRSLGLAYDEDITLVKSNLYSAVREAEKELGSLVGKSLAIGLNNWVEESYGRRIQTHPSVLTLRLEGADTDELVAIFGKAINTVRGVESARILNQQIIPKQPQKCFVTWQVKIDTYETDTFRLKTNLNKLVNDILFVGGYIQINGVTRRYSRSQLRMLKGLRSAKLTPTFIQFVLDRDRARARDLSDYHDPDVQYSRYLSCDYI